MDLITDKACPECLSGAALCLKAVRELRLVCVNNKKSGTSSAEFRPEGDYEFDEGSGAYCGICGWAGRFASCQLNWRDRHTLLRLVQRYKELEPEYRPVLSEQLWAELIRADEDMIRWCPLPCFSRDIVEQLINYYSA